MVLVLNQIEINYFITTYKLINKGFLSKSKNIFYNLLIVNELRRLIFLLIF